MTPRTAAQTSTLGNVTSAEVRILLKEMSRLVSLIADGQLTVDGRPLAAPADPSQGTGDPQGYRRTVKELRAEALAVDGQTWSPETPPAPRPKPTKILQPRRVYELIVPRGGKINMDGLTPAGVAILRYLSVHEQAAIVTLMKDLALKRSTVANVLTELKRRKLVESVAID